MEQKKEKSSQSEEGGQKNIPKNLPFSSFMNNSFFEVTINAAKLNSLFESINESFFQQNKKIDKLTRDLQAMNSSLQAKMQAQSRKNGQLFSKLDMKIEQNSTTQHCVLLEAFRKCQQKEIQLASRIESLNSKLGRVQDYFKEDLRNSLQYLKREIIGSTDYFQEQKAKQQEQKQKGASSLENLTMQNKKIDFKYLLKTFSEQLAKTKQQILKSFEQFYESKETEKKKKITPTSNLNEPINKREKIQKLQRVESNIENKFENTNMKIVYPTIASKKQSERIFSPIKDKENDLSAVEIIPRQSKARQMSFSRISVNADDDTPPGLEDISQRISYLQQIVTEQGSIVSDMRNKEIVIDEKTLILNRKLDKGSAQIAQVKNSIRRIEGQKLDQKTIQQLRNYVKWGLRDLEDKLVKKCSQEDLLKQKIKLNEKISIVHENLVEKADKAQIQKALVFLQTKIKEIIFLIAAEQSQERQGAIVKVATKCLSCDKQMQKQMQSKLAQKRDQHRKTEAQYIKSMTHRVRQRYKKQINKTLTLASQICEDV